MYWIAFGDIHENIAAALRIPGLARAEAVIVTGDWTNRGGRLAVQALYRSIEALNPRILAQLGNMDTQAVADYLREQGADIHLKARELAPGVGIMGVGCSAPTPFATPSEVEDRQLEVWLRQTFELARGFERLVAVIHEPPFNTAADRLSNGAHVGSRAVRAWIEEVQPDIVLTGHIHESRGQERLGRTLVLNPGMLSLGGFVRMTLDGGELSAGLESV